MIAAMGPMPALDPDCERCAALCCVGPAFDKSEDFAIDKPAAAPCPKLADTDRCTIHESLAEHGFSGCIRYNCYGAGQRIVQELFAGKSWREDPAVALQMFAALPILREIHELIGLLQTAEKLSLPGRQERQRAEHEARLRPVEGWTSVSLATFQRDQVASEVRNWLSTLRGHVDAERGNRS